MFSKSKLNYLLGFLILCGVLTDLLFFSSFGKSSSPPPETPSCADKNGCTTQILEEKQQLINQFTTSDPKQIYARLKDDYKDKPAADQHSMAHLFGQILYKQVGTSGIDVCDGNFAFGCFHGFFIEAVSDKGIGIVKDLDKSCIEKFGELGLGCQHGIGHGLMEYLGPKKLVQALQICGELSWQKPLLGCAGGVFMEYNLPLSENSSSRVVSASRSLNIDHPYDPCYSVPARFQQECFYQLGLWWNQVLNKDYQKMLILCSDINDPLLQQRCLLGVGNAAATTSSLNLIETKQLCDQTDSQSNQTLCRAGAAWVFAGMPQTKKISRFLCNDLNSESQVLCQKNSNLLNTF